MAELYELIVDVAARAVAVADAALRGLYDLYAAGASDGMDAGPLAAGAAGAGALGAGSAAGGDRAGGRGDRGFRYTSGDGTLYDSASGGTTVGRAPNGSRLVYDQIARDANGDPTHYRVRPPGGTPGWIPAGNTSDTRPLAPPPPRPSKIVDSGVDVARSSSAQTAGSRG